jgi:hypothetical protein
MPVDFSGAVEPCPETCPAQVLFIVVVVFLSQVILIPLEVFEQDEAPSLVKIDQPLDFL